MIPCLPAVRMLLDPAFGQSLIDADFSVYATNAAWREHFKGSKSAPNPAAAASSALNPMPAYRTCASTTTTPQTRRPTTSSSTQMPPGGPLPPQLASRIPSPQRQPRHRHGRACCPRGCRGSYLSLDLSGLDSLNAADGTVINRAEVVLPVDAPSKLPRPSTLTAFLKGVNGGLGTRAGSRVARGHLRRHL